MENTQYITLTELYIFNPAIFESKYLNNFLRTFKISEDDMVKLKGNQVGIKCDWVRKNIPSFNFNLTIPTDDRYFEVKTVLEKYNCKSLNPISLRLDSTMVKYFLKESQRTPYFTVKGLIKIMVYYNDLDDVIFDWIYELNNGDLKPQQNNLNNIIEMVKLNHPPIVKKNTMELSGLCSFETGDTVVDFRRVGDFKKQKPTTLSEYKCPIYSQVESHFQTTLKELQTEFNHKLNIQTLQHELEKEKMKQVQLSQSLTPLPNFLKPSKID